MKLYIILALALIGYWYITPPRVTVVTQVTAQSAAPVQAQQPAPSATNTKQQFALDLAKALGNAQPTEATMLFIEAWAKAEGGNATFNPLNTTMPMDGATNYNSVGVKNYTSYQQGLTATIRTLQGNYNGYAGIVQGITTNNPQLALTSLAASPWGTNAVNVMRIYNEAIAQRRVPQAQPVAYVPTDTEAPRGNPLNNPATIITQAYGVGTHAPAATMGGLDLALAGSPAATMGAPVYAIMGGTVRVSTTALCGNGLEITRNGYRVLYCHLQAATVPDGSTVQYGQAVARAGSSGASSGPHVHVAVWKDGVNQNPIDYATK